MAEPPGPDLRFVQANERTLLAWVRTSLGLLGLGFVIARARLLLSAALPGEPSGPTDPSSLALVEWVGTGIAAIAPVAIAMGLYRYHRAHKALVEGTPTPASALGPSLFAMLLGIVALAGAIYLVVTSA
jgi:putative membrane protein